MTSNRQQLTKLIKENAMLEDFNKQNPRTLEKPNKIKTRGQVTKGRKFASK